MKVKCLGLLALVLLCSSGHGAAHEFCLNPELEKQPILKDGRIKPLFAYARDTRRSLFPKNTCRKLSDTALYCLLSFGQRTRIEKDYGCQIRLSVDHAKAQQLLGLHSGQRSISPESAFKAVSNLYSAHEVLVNDDQKDSAVASNIVKHINRIQTLNSIENGMDWQTLGTDGQWLPLNHRLKKHGSKEIQSVLLQSRAQLSSKDIQSLKLETLYEKTQPFSWAIVVCLLGFVFSLLGLRFRRFYVGSGISLVLLSSIYVYGMTLRTMISGWAPVTNMYETVMFSGFGILVLCGLLGLVLKDKRIWALGFCANCIVLFAMKSATQMFDASIQPLVPVLRDNFWLGTHVTAVIFSYACYGLSWFVANFILIRSLWNHKLDITPWVRLIRMALQIGTVFLAAGIILGGIWADYSWGRFWGWDPKETWSLITLVVYIAILHGRYVGWFKGINFVLMSTVGFLFVLMTWFGVNYILASGLHTYGFSTGGALFLASTFLVQLSLIGIALLKHHVLARGST